MRHYSRQRGLGDVNGETVEQMPRVGFKDTAAYQATVRSLYIEILGRDADEGGLNFFVNQLASGAASPAEIRQGLLDSQEYKNLQQDAAAQQAAAQQAAADAQAAVAAAQHAADIALAAAQAAAAAQAVATQTGSAANQAAAAQAATTAQAAAAQAAAAQAAASAAHGTAATVHTPAHATASLFSSKWLTYGLLGFGAYLAISE